MLVLSQISCWAPHSPSSLSLSLEWPTCLCQPVHTTEFTLHRDLMRRIWRRVRGKLCFHGSAAGGAGRSAGGGRGGASSAAPQHLHHRRHAEKDRLPAEARGAVTWVASCACAVQLVCSPGLLMSVQSSRLEKWIVFISSISKRMGNKLSRAAEVIKSKMTRGDYHFWVLAAPRAGDKLLCKLNMWHSAYE